MLNEAIQNYVQTLPPLERKTFIQTSRKLVTQVKMIKDKDRLDENGEQRPSGLAFCEIAKEEVAMFVVRRLNNFIVRKGAKRGLIVDFAI